MRQAAMDNTALRRVMLQHRQALEDKARSEVCAQVAYLLDSLFLLPAPQSELSEFKREIKVSHGFINEQLDQFEDILKVVRSQNDKRELVCFPSFPFMCGPMDCFFH